MQRYSPEKTTLAAFIGMLLGGIFNDLIRGDASNRRISDSCSTNERDEDFLLNEEIELIDGFGDLDCL